MRSISRRSLVGALVAVPALALAPAAGAVTLIGSGSSAAQPYMLKLFKGYSAIHRSVHFRYSPDGGNAGVQDVQQGRSQFAINTRPPLGFSSPQPTISREDLPDPDGPVSATVWP